MNARLGNLNVIPEALGPMEGVYAKGKWILVLHFSILNL